MTLQELYRLIGLQPEIAEKLEKLEFEMPEGLLKGMMRPETAESSYKELDACLTEDGDHLKMLLCQLECARRQFDQYREMGISREIFADTMKCFTRFIGECGRQNGRTYFDRGWWTYRQISMTLFRIGELEYEFQTQDGDPVLSLHIPSDADLTPAKLDCSLEQAADFFRTYYPDYSWKRYVCHSWLLSPKLKELLPERSRILAFQNRFRLTEADAADNGAIHWIFQVSEGTPYASLPEDTSLQRSAKALLLSGGSIGSAHGEIAR